MARHGGTLAGWWPPPGSDDPEWVRPLALLSSVASTYISTLSRDADHFSCDGFPLPLEQFVPTLRDGLWLMICGKAGAPPLTDGGGQRRLLRAGGRLLMQLFERNGRRAFLPLSAFHAPGPFAIQSFQQLPTGYSDDEDDNGGKDDTGRCFGSGLGHGHASPSVAADPGSRTALALRYAPYLVPFRLRAEAFQRTVAEERAAHQADVGAFGGPPSFVPVRRDNELIDGFDALGEDVGALKTRVRVQYFSGLGFVEAGVDGGGLFKEFLEAAIRQGFDPAFGLFVANSEGRLFPSIDWIAELGSVAVPLLRFVGRLVGKALLEGLLVELPLADFFLEKILGRHCELRDLDSLDEQLAANLEKLRAYDANTLAGLDLAFVFTDVRGGEADEVELVPRGAEIAVTPSNVVEYVHRVADFKLNRQLAGPVRAFVTGLRSVVPARWLAPFSAAELQALVSGGSQGMDVADLAAHVAYGGGYDPDHPVVRRLWRVLHEFTPEQQAQFLRFVTSCPRPPLLGFQYLYPPLTAQMAGSPDDRDAQQRLPSASTCMNLLKLPPYADADIMKQKLAYAIAAGAGFELS